MDGVRDISYVYDGTFEGLLCCVYESFYKKETPAAICAEGRLGEQLLFSEQRYIQTDPERAGRVARSISEKISGEAADLVTMCYFTCLENKELAILDFLRRGYKVGKRFTEMLTDDAMRKVKDAVKRMNNESGKFKGFVRFSVYGNVKVAVIRPENFVLPLISHHFCHRYQRDEFMIYDETHGCALVHRPPETAIIPMDSLVMYKPSAEETMYRELWRKYYDTIAIQARINPRGRMTQMPKRYWDYMTEFGSPAVARLEVLERDGLLEDKGIAALLPPKFAELDAQEY